MPKSEQGSNPVQRSGGADDGSIRVALADQHSGTDGSHFLSSEAGSIPGNRTLRRVMSKVLRHKAQPLIAGQSNRAPSHLTHHHLHANNHRKIIGSSIF